MRDLASFPSISALLAMVCVLLLAALAPLQGAVTDQTPTDISLAGIADTTSAAATDGNTFTNTGYEFAEVINGSGSSITVTIDVYPSGGLGAPGGLAVTDPTVTVAAGARKRIGPFRKRLYNDASEKVKLTVSLITTITIGVYRLTPSP